MYADAIARAATEAPTLIAPTPVVKGLGVHIDGDYLAYYAAGPDDRTPGEARLKALDDIEKFKTRVGAAHVIMHNTARGCQKGERYLIAQTKPYQIGRVGGTKPKNQPYLQEFLQTYDGPLFRAKNWTSREADDGIGACAHHGLGTPHGYIAIVTADKDMRMLPGLHCDWLSLELVRVNPGDYSVMGSPRQGTAKGLPIIKPGKQYGLKFFFLQMLMGDEADSIPGLGRWREKNPDGSHKGFKAVGEKTAEKLLADIDNVQAAFARVLYLYRDAHWGRDPHIADDLFVEQAALLWMRLDNKATVGDFARHMGASRINHLFDAPLWAAVERLETRVLDARRALNELGHCDNS